MKDRCKWWWNAQANVMCLTSEVPGYLPMMYVCDQEYEDDNHSTNPWFTYSIDNFYLYGWEMIGWI